MIDRTQTYAQRQASRIRRLGLILDSLEKAAKGAPQAWGTDFRDAVEETKTAAEALTRIEIPEGYRRRRRPAKLAVGAAIVVRSKERRDVYRSMIPSIDSVGTITQILTHDGVLSARVSYAGTIYGPVPLRYLSPAERPCID